jgi:Rrf2 family transcriptional regulator, nitric oxide-sensitive transcriptional repressor
MHLTLWTDYALRTLIYLGVKGDGLATIAEIAEGFDISRPHLMKIVNRLGAQGYVDTVRGRRGGIKLARPPAEIRVGAVIRDTEEDLAVMGCLSGSEPGFCRIEGCCVLRRALREATLAFLEVLDRYTLADLLAPDRRLAESLGLALATRLSMNSTSPGAPGAGGAQHG